MVPKHDQCFIESPFDNQRLAVRFVVLYSVLLHFWWCLNRLVPYFSKLFRRAARAGYSEISEQDV